MVFNGLHLKYSLEGTFNFVAWKDNMEAVLDDNWLLEYIKSDFVKPQAFDANNFAQWNIYVAKVGRIILEGVQDHIVSNIHGKKYSFSMRKVVT